MREIRFYTYNSQAEMKTEVEKMCRDAWNVSFVSPIPVLGENPENWKYLVMFYLVYGQ